MAPNWSANTSWEIVCKRAAGRKGYNWARGNVAFYRRCRIAHRLLDLPLRRGVQRVLAAEFGVSEATISRDLASLRPFARWCPTCGRLQSCGGRAGESPEADAG